MISEKNSGKSFNVSIAFAKVLGIFFMVVGHSGCPQYLHDIIYTFHMPLFFICSGYFFRICTSANEIKSFVIRRIKGLYLPYLKWGAFFLILNNLFVYYGLLDNSSPDSYFSWRKLLELSGKLLLMGGASKLIAGFWFLNVLLKASLVTSFSYFLFRKMPPFLLVVILILGANVSEFVGWSSLKMAFIGGSYYAFGYWLRLHNNILNNYSIALLGLIALLFSMSFLHTEMICLTINTIFPYIVCSCLISVSVLFLCNRISPFFSREGIKHYIINANNAAITILALHVLSFKVVSLLKIYYYDFPFSSLSRIPVVAENNSFWWIWYVIIGYFIPLLIYTMYVMITRKIRSKLIV